jgi:hypothetical protein
MPHTYLLSALRVVKNISNTPLSNPKLTLSTSCPESARKDKGSGYSSDILKKKN